MNPLAKLKPRIEQLIAQQRWQDLCHELGDYQVPDIAEILTALNKTERVLVFRALPRELSSQVFAYWDIDEQNELIHSLSDEETRHLLATMSPDDRTAFLEELPGRVTQRLMNLLAPDDLKEARHLLGYPKESVGRLMTPDYIAVRPNWTVQQALDHIRTYGREKETIDLVFVTDENWKLLDVLTLRSLILALSEQRISELMERSFFALSAFDDRELAVEMIRHYDVVALPVVDSDGILIGIVTVDDILDVAEAEATEDFQKVGGVATLNMPYHEASPFWLYRKRIGWLFILVFMNVFSGAALEHFEDTIAARVSLLFFLPLLIASSGNAGSQSATLMVRALATGDIGTKDWARLFLKEIGVAGLLGLTLGLTVWGLGLYRGGAEVAIIVAMTMVVVVLAGSLVGMCLPFLLSRLKQDPAIASAPLVASVADITGVLIYFTIASRVLGI